MSLVLTPEQAAKLTPSPRRDALTAQLMRAILVMSDDALEELARQVGDVEAVLAAWAKGEAERQGDALPPGLHVRLPVEDVDENHPLRQTRKHNARRVPELVAEHGDRLRAFWQARRPGPTESVSVRKSWRYAPNPVVSPLMCFSTHNLARPENTDNENPGHT